MKNGGLFEKKNVCLPPASPTDADSTAFENKEPPKAPGGALVNLFTSSAATTKLFV